MPMFVFYQLRGAFWATLPLPRARREGKRRQRYFGQGSAEIVAFFASQTEPAMGGHGAAQGKVVALLRRAIHMQGNTS